MGLFKILYTGGLYSFAAAGMFSIGAITYSAVNAATSTTEEKPAKVIQAVEEPETVRDVLADKVKEAMAQEMMGESFERMIQKKINKGIREYVQSEEFIDDLRKDDKYTSDYRKWVK